MRTLKTLFLLLNLFGLTVYSTENETITLSKMQSHNLGIKVGKLKSIQDIPVLNAPAKVVVPPSQEYIVSASQAGLISKLNVSIGDSVKKGQVLANINSPALLTLQQQLLKATSDRNLAWASYQRDKKLLDEGVISDRRWQETRTRYSGHASEANEAKQLLEIAGMSEKDIKQLAKTRRLSSTLDVHSPINGIVLERMAVAGKRIDILAPLFRIANLDQLWLEINIPHERINGIKPGDQVLIENTSTTARISLLGQSVNPENQTILARAIIDTNQSEVRAGQTVNTRLIQSSDKPAFYVPNAAVAKSEGNAYIFIKTDEGFLVKAVEIMGKEGSHSIIRSDLKGDEDIAVRGAVALKANWMGLGSGENGGGHGGH